MFDFLIQARAHSARLIPDLPLVVWMILISLILGLSTGYSSKELIATYNAGWGYAIGEFALILLPAFVLAAVLEQRRIQINAGISVGLAPLAGAGMVCPDTAYAAIAPMVRRRKLLVAFGAYTGFKLLFPAGPLIVATSLGVDDGKLLAVCVLVFLPVWAVGLLCGMIIESRFLNSHEKSESVESRMPLSVLWPFIMLATLLTVGVLADMTFNVWLDFATNPKGALLLTAAASLLVMVPHAERRDCIDTGLRRTGALLLIIGAASAFSAILTSAVPIGDFFSTQSPMLTLISLFVLTAIFKLLQGSSMSTFAAVGPIALPVVVASSVSPISAVIAICLGSFIAILPNDSYYWLVRQDAMPDISDAKATAILAISSTLLAGSGIIALIIVTAIGLT